MTETEVPDTTEAWRQRGQEDAPIALRAIARSMFQYGKETPGYACASAILEAYARDLKRGMGDLLLEKPKSGWKRLLGN